MKKIEPQPELKPCPFCGSKHAELRIRTDGYLAVLCGGCGCSSGILPYSKENQVKVVDGWNRRIWQL